LKAAALRRLQSGCGFQVEVKTKSVWRRSALKTTVMRIVGRIAAAHGM
jgi:hypothetical protein